MAGAFKNAHYFYVIFPGKRRQRNAARRSAGGYYKLNIVLKQKFNIFLCIADYRFAAAVSVRYSAGIPEINYILPGITCITCLTVVSPPSPLSNTPIGRLSI